MKLKRITSVLMCAAVMGLSACGDGAGLAVSVSKKSGKVSVACGGELYNGLNQEGLREKLELLREADGEENRRGRRLHQRGGRGDKKAAKENNE